MELNSSIKKLAQYRSSLRAQTTFTHASQPHIENTLSQLDLLQKICKNLPESQQSKCHYFENLLRQNSHSPEFATRRKTRLSTVPIIRTQTTTNDDLHLESSLHHYQNLFEIELQSLASMHEYFHNIFIGGLNEANDEALLIQNEIRGIVSIGQENEPIKFNYVSSGYFMIVKDEKHFVRDSMKSGFVPIEAMLRKGRVLVHSRDGRTHAPVVVIAFLMKKFNLIFSAAKEMVVKGHPQVLISSGLEEQLKKVNRVIS